MSSPTWKLRIVRDEYADGPEDWPWMVDGYLPDAPKGMGKAWGKNTHPAYTEDVSHFATYALAVDFAGLVLRMVRNPEVRATDAVHPHAFEAGQLAGELYPHAGPVPVTNMREHYRLTETREEEYLRERLADLVDHVELQQQLEA